MPESVTQQGEPTRYGAWLEENQRERATTFGAVPANEQAEVEAENDGEESEQVMVREREPKRTVGIRVAPEVYEEFEERAKLDGVSVSELLRDLLVSSNSPAIKRKRLRELLKKAVSELRTVAAEEGPRKRKADLLESVASGFISVVEEPHEATILADRIVRFIEKNLAESKQGGR